MKCTNSNDPYIMDAIITRNELVDRPEKDWTTDKGAQLLMMIMMMIMIFKIMKYSIIYNINLIYILS